MDKATQQLMAKAMLLPKEQRQELVIALDDELAELQAKVATADYSAFNEALDEMIEQADKAGRRRKLDDKDVPELWHSEYYLRQGYHLSSATVRQPIHWQGGDVAFKNAKCLNCHGRLHLIWDIDCEDPRFRKEHPEVFARLRRLPLMYSLPIAAPTAYQCQDARTIRMVSCPGDSDESPFSDFPDALARRPLSLKQIPSNIENLLVLCGTVGADWLRHEDKRSLARYLGIRRAKYVGLYTRRSQFGGLPAIQQGNAALDCPNKKCPTHTWGHPILRTKAFYQMKLLAVVDHDAA